VMSALDRGAQWRRRGQSFRGNGIHLFFDQGDGRLFEIV
jgi:hypothetical protein